MDIASTLPVGIWQPYETFKALPKPVQRYVELDMMTVFSAAPQKSSGGRYNLGRYSDFRRALGSRTVTEWIILPPIPGE
ncbi:hypothetical protein Gekk315_00075 [Aeromonas phage Gekk3-15]